MKFHASLHLVGFLAAIAARHAARIPPSPLQTPGAAFTAATDSLSLMDWDISAIWMDSTSRERKA